MMVNPCEGRRPPNPQPEAYVDVDAHGATAQSARPATSVAGSGGEARLRGRARPRRWHLPTEAEALTPTVRTINGTLT